MAKYRKGEEKRMFPIILDQHEVRALEHLASLTRTSRADVVRYLIDQAATRAGIVRPESRLSLLAE